MGQSGEVSRNGSWNLKMVILLSNKTTFQATRAVKSTLASREFCLIWAQHSPLCKTGSLWLFLLEHVLFQSLFQTFAFFAPTLNPRIFSYTLSLVDCVYVKITRQILNEWPIHRLKMRKYNITYTAYYGVGENKNRFKKRAVVPLSVLHIAWK